MMVQCKHLQNANKRFSVLPLLAKGLVLTWCLAAHQRCSHPPESSAWVRTEHTKQEMGGTGGKWVTKKSQGVSPSILQSLGNVMGC